jgi:hypothetical protein
MKVPHLQLRDLPKPLHDAIRDRARRSGVSMREYVLRLIDADLGRRDSLEETLARLERLPKAQGAPPAADLVAEGRRERDAAPRA